MRRAFALVPLLAVAAVVDLGIAAEGVVRWAGPRSWRAAEDADRLGRLVFLGFDGVDPRILKEYLDKGELPAIAALVAKGGLHPLQSEIPPESPVAWASVLTGVGPGKHGIPDFVVRDPATTGYRPVNGMVELSPPPFLFGKIPTRPPRVDARLAYPTCLERVANAGYRVLGIRPPLTFPVKEVLGIELLSGLGTPDLAGTNGAYAYYDSGLWLGRDYTIFNGHRIHLDGGPQAASFDTYLEGPFDRRRRLPGEGFPRITVPLRFERALPDGPVTIVLAGTRTVVEKGETTSWLTVPFTMPTLPAISFTGRVKFTVQSVEPLQVLTEPVQIDPSHPALPISTPRDFAARLEQQYGPYATMGWLEPTFPLNDGLMTDEDFLKHVLELMDRDHAILLGQISRGAHLVFQVFTQTDRASHCFYWLRDPEHPYYDTARAARFAGKDPLLEVYRRMDRVVGDVVARLGANDVLLVGSDHGFQSFRYGVNVNQWLINEGYLVLKDASAQVGVRDLSQFFGESLSMDDVDWSKTRAYALGLGQVYVNRRGREPMGIVDKADVPALSREIRGKLLAFEDRHHPGTRPLSKVYLLADVYRGPKVDEGAELQLGFGPNYRVSWQTALMGDLKAMGTDPIEINRYPWSGDHCSTDRDLVPGILLTNRPLPKAPADRPYSVRDIAATILDHFHVDIADLEGESKPLPLPSLPPK